MKPYRIGVIGLNFGVFHLRTVALMQQAELAAIADLRPEPLERLGAQYKAATYRDALEMIEKEPLDAVIVSTSPKYRRPILEAAVRRGLALFIEKPWATNSAQAAEFAEVCAGSKAPVMVGFSFRFLPAMRKLRELVPDTLGAPWMVRAHYVSDFLPGPDGWLWDPENGNGYFNENSCHVFDAVNALMGRPESLYASGAAYRGSPREDGALVQLRYVGGATASVAVGGLGVRAFGNYPQMDVWAEHGQAHLEGNWHIWTDLSWARRDEPERCLFRTDPEALGSTRYTEALGHFLQCIEAGRQPEATVEDGVLTVRMAEAVHESIRSGEPVSL